MQAGISYTAIISNCLRHLFVVSYYNVIKFERIVSTQKANRARAADVLFYCAAYRGGNTTVRIATLNFP